MRQKVEIEVDVPDGWRAVAYRLPLLDEWILNWNIKPELVQNKHFTPWLIIEKVEPKRESRWHLISNEICGHNTIASAEASRCSYHAIERRDYENGKLVAVTLEPEGEEA